MTTASINEDANISSGEGNLLTIPKRSASKLAAAILKSAIAATAKRSLRRVRIGRWTEEATAPAPITPTRTI